MKLVFFRKNRDDVDPVGVSVAWYFTENVQSG